MQFIPSKPHLLSLVVLFLMPVCITAQQIEVELPLYFEDAVGNRDTIILAYGEGFKFDSVYTHLGEDTLEAQMTFDNDLTVFTSKLLPWAFVYFFSKKAIVGVEVCFNYYPQEIPIIVKCKYPPLKISWDESPYCHLDGNCQKFLFWFFNNNAFYFTQHDYENYEYKTAVVCEDDPEDIIEPMGLYTPQGGHYTIYREQENEDGSIDSLYLFYGRFQMKGSTSTSQLDAPTKSTQIYPNPVTGNVLHIESTYSSSVHITLYDISGKVVIHQINFHLHPGINEVAIQYDLVPGNYLLAIRHQNGLTDWHKVVRN